LIANNRKPTVQFEKKVIYEQHLVRGKTSDTPHIRMCLAVPTIPRDQNVWWAWSQASMNSIYSKTAGDNFPAPTLEQ
jgi:hypothetical protein